MNTQTASGKFESDAHFDALYLAARRQHEEALRCAAMDRLAHSVNRRRQQGKARWALPIHPAGALQTVAMVIGRWGRPSIPGLGG